MISLAFLPAKYAVEGLEVTILWGQSGGRQKEIRAKITQFPYYNGEFRNETFNTENIPRQKFE